MLDRKAYVADLQDQQVVESIFLVSSTSLRETRNGDPYLCVTLQDRTGSIEARAWDDAAALAARFDAEDFVAIRGRVSMYREVLQLTLTDIQRIDEADLNLRDFLPHSRWSTESLLETMVQLVEEEIESDEVRRFLQALLADTDFQGAYQRAPAAKQNHHAYLGGLLEHSLSMARLALSMGRHYRAYYPGLVNVDLVVAGCIIHDMGKVEELSAGRTFDYTTEGKLLGHIAMGVARVDAVARDLSPPLPDELLLQLKHLILSHHGKQEYGSPVVPQTPEALLLHHLDMVDSRMNMCWNAAQPLVGDEDARPGWTDYDRVLRSAFFLGTPATAPEPVDTSAPGLATGDGTPDDGGDGEAAEPALNNPNLSLFGD